MAKHQGSLLALAAVSTLATMTLACQELNTPLYFGGPAIWAAGGDDPLPVNGVKLRFRTPTMQEQMKLDAERDARGYDMDIPWISRDKVHVEVSYKVTYRCPTEAERAQTDGLTFTCKPEDLPSTATFTVIADGASEFTKYDTEVVSAALMQGPNDPKVFLPLITAVPQTLPLNGSFSGIVREDDFSEGELDLDALGRWNDPDTASPTFAGVLINRSEVPPYIGMGMVPGYVKNGGSITRDNPNLLVVPAMYEIDLRLKADAPMVLEYFVRVRDDDDRLLHNDADRLYEPSPALFQPPATM
jgi:hypothetical protein